MAGITEVMEALNIIELLNIFLPAGFGEVITLIMFNSSFALMAVAVVIYTLTKERLFIDVKARITNQGKGIIVYPDGSTKEVLIKRKQFSLEETLTEKNILKWEIRPEGWDRQSNGVPITIFHYDCSYNIGITEFAKFYKGYKQDIMGQDAEGKIVKVGEIPYRPLILSAREVDANIVKLANAEVASMIDPNKALVNAAIAISIIFAVAISGAILFIFIVPSAPQGAAPAAAAAVEATTTTLANSGVAGVGGG